MKFILSNFFILLFFLSSPVYAESFYKEFSIKVSGFKIGELVWTLEIDNNNYSNEYTYEYDYDDPLCYNNNRGGYTACRDKRYYLYNDNNTLYIKTKKTLFRESSIVDPIFILFKLD